MGKWDLLTLPLLQITPENFQASPEFYIYVNGPRKSNLDFWNFSNLNFNFIIMLPYRNEHFKMLLLLQISCDFFQTSAVFLNGPHKSSFWFLKFCKFKF